MTSDHVTKEKAIVLSAESLDWYDCNIETGVENQTSGFEANFMPFENMAGF